MKIIDILKQDKMSLSFEVFPPKKETSFESVKAATESIAALGPAFMSVTYGAGGGVSHFTIDIAKNLKEKYNIPMLAHLTCVSSSKETVHQRIADMKAAGIKNVMALRGDLTPELIEKGRDNCDYHYAVELIQELKAADADFCIGAACYPEKHPESANQKEDIKHLKEKVDAGADFLTTQMVFDNNLFFNFMYKLREAGVTCPVLPGIMPPRGHEAGRHHLRQRPDYRPVRQRHHQRTRVLHEQARRSRRNPQERFRHLGQDALITKKTQIQKKLGNRVTAVPIFQNL